MSHLKQIYGMVCQFWTLILYKVFEHTDKDFEIDKNYIFLYIDKPEPKAEIPCQTDTIILCGHRWRHSHEL